MKTNITSWGILKKLVLDKEPHLQSHLPSKVEPFAQILRQRKSVLLLVVFPLTPKCGNDIKTKLM